MNNNIEIPLNTATVSPKAGISGLLQSFLFNKKNNYKKIVVALIVFAILLPVAIFKFGLISGIFILVAMATLPFLYAIIAYPKFGILVLMVAAYLLMWFIKMGIGFPIGTLLDGLQALLLIGLLIKAKYDPPKNVFQNPITVLIVLWITYNVLEVANPIAASKLSWLYTIRTVATVMLMYFVFMYHIKTLRFIKIIIKLWLALSLFAAFYALWQEYVGFLPFEQSGLKNPDVRSLLFIDGHWRKFSIFAEPVTFSYNMVISSLLCIGLLSGHISKKRKIILGSMAVLFMYVMLFSGTRGAYVLLPIGLSFLAILKLNRKIFAVAIAVALVFLFFVFIPTSNYTLYRFQTAFQPSSDASYNVRKTNQKRIQPYILDHPFGGGLGATGGWGKRFAPNSYLASFPPDSGYVRVAVELGWVGLFLFCTLMVTILKTGINNYYRIKDPDLKSICLAMLLIIFALSVGNYPQEAFVQFPTNIYLFLAIAIINITKHLDNEKQKAFAI